MAGGRRRERLVSMMRWLGREVRDHTWYGHTRGNRGRGEGKAFSPKVPQGLMTGFWG